MLKHAEASTYLDRARAHFKIRQVGRIHFVSFGYVPIQLVNASITDESFDILILVPWVLIVSPAELKISVWHEVYHLWLALRGFPCISTIPHPKPPNWLNYVYITEDYVRKALPRVNRPMLAYITIYNDYEDQLVNRELLRIPAVADDFIKTTTRGLRSAVHTFQGMPKAEKKVFVTSLLLASIHVDLVLTVRWNRELSIVAEEVRRKTFKVEPEFRNLHERVKRELEAARFTEDAQEVHARIVELVKKFPAGFWTRFGEAAR